MAARTVGPTCRSLLRPEDSLRWSVSQFELNMAAGCATWQLLHRCLLVVQGRQVAGWWRLQARAAGEQVVIISGGVT